MFAVDIGAHAGEYTLMLAELCGEEGMVYAFEPQTELADIIQQNVDRNHRFNIRVHQCALGKNTTEVGFVCNQRSRGGWTTSGGEATVTVQQTSLDDFLLRAELPRVDFIKLDAAGNELAVLEGAGRLIRALKPIIMCQIYHPEVIWERHHSYPERIIEALQEQDYDLSLFDESVSSTRTRINDGRELATYLQTSGRYASTLVALPRIQETPSRTIVR